MAVTPTGNSILVNQQTPIVANKIGDLQNRFDLQSYAAAENAKQQDKRLKESRPVEKNQKMDNEEEHDKETSREEQGYTKEIEKMLHSNQKEISNDSEDEEIEYVEDEDYTILDVKV
jgi:E3 ubiquitin-protein ligase DOA10